MRSPQEAARQAAKVGAVNQAKMGRASPVAWATARQLSTAPHQGGQHKAHRVAPMPHCPTVRQVRTSCTPSAPRAMAAEVFCRSTPLRT